MTQTITMRFICNILEWNWTNILLSHNFPNLTPLSVNLAPRLHFIITMGNTVAITTNYYWLIPPQQKQILEACMHHEPITWATVLSKVYPAVKDQQFLADLIESHKNGTAVPPATPPLTQEATKRPNGHITPNEGKPAAFPD